ncbi:meiotic recombination protein SPO11-like [Tubulanus polymorphus]|uniref:meiotic recombination protein SPO11-like n=1 Tax=Tubulanus polymorphus TaxID=672921 RepID=UPI003DA3D53E
MDSDDTVLKKIEQIMLSIVKTLSLGEPPSLLYDSRSTWDNISFHEETGLQMKLNPSMTVLKYNVATSVNRYALTLKVISLIYKLVQTNSFCTKRDIFYQDKNLFASQAVVDDIIDNISCMLKVPRWQLHVIATSKGCIAGQIQYTEQDGNVVNCSASNSGVLVSSNIVGLENIRTNAKLVLIIEKDATFQKLLDEGICQKLYPCIVITGKGFPDVNTRLMVKKIWDIFHIPMFALVDADPHGIEIMCIYKFGSRSLSFEGHNLAVPAIHWLGILPSDVERLHISKEVVIPLTKTDIAKANELEKRPYFQQNKVWQAELTKMIHWGHKAEIQSLSSISMDFLSEVYLPNKLRYAGWI